MRILVAQLNPIIGDFRKNSEKILSAIEFGKKQHAELVIFSELALSGYPPEDFLLLPTFIEAVEQNLEIILQATQGISIILGLPRRNLAILEKPLFNSAAIIQNGKILGYQDKALLPTYDVFDEKRYFEPGGQFPLWSIGGKKVAVTICEDIWQHSELVHDTFYRLDPIKEIKELQPDILINLSSSPFSYAKLNKRLQVCTKAAQALNCPVILCNQVGGNDSLIFDGQSLCISSSGELLAMGKEFEEDLLLVETEAKERMSFPTFSATEQLYKALVLGVKDYFTKSDFQKACLGLSGGIDSAVVASIAVEALGQEHVLGVRMPSCYSSENSLADAAALADNLDISYITIPIESPFQSYLDLLAPQFKGKPAGTTEENLQARIRGMILMALSNKHGYIVLSTGNKSELAVGYSTLYGDLCGGLAVISDVTKKQVYALANWINRQREIIPLNTISKPPSAELRPNQLDSDSLPPYDILDNIIESYIEQHQSPQAIIDKFGYAPDLVLSIIKKIHQNEYKRRQGPLGLRVTDKAFTLGRRFPIVQGFIR